MTSSSSSTSSTGELTASSAAVLADWVAEVLLPTYVRPWDRPTLRWCAWWWRHAEAWVRLEACHRAWVELNTPTGTGLSIWHRDHLDPMLRELLGENGPFARCHPPGPSEPGSHTDPDPFPIEPLEFTVVDAATGAVDTDTIPATPTTDPATNLPTDHPGPTIERTSS